MRSIRVPVLCAFGVGCLTSAALFGLWRADHQADAQSSPRALSAQVVTTPRMPPEAPVVDDSARSEAQAETARVETADRGNDTKSEPAPDKDPQGVANASPPPGGSAVSDVLMDLEAAYRQRLIAAARAEAAARADAEPAPSHPTPPPAPATAEPAREVAARVAAAPVAPPAAVAVAPAAVAVAPAAPVEVAPAAPPVPVAPIVVAQNETRKVHFGDVNQNTYITNVRQGDVYVIQQQLAMLNYMQMNGTAANPAVMHSPSVARGVQHQPPQSQFRQFPSTLTNLDNPWGFNFSPPNLVH